MEGMKSTKTRQQVYNKPLFTIKTEEAQKSVFVSPVQKEDNRVLQQTGERPAYFDRICAIKNRLDGDCNGSDSTGTYTAMRDMVNFFVENYKYFDATMEIRMLTVLHAKALDYYNTHRGIRFSPQGRYRKSIANDLMSSVMDTVENELPEDLRIEAMLQLSSTNVPPKMFANEPDYVTDVTVNSEVLGKYFTDYAKEKYRTKVISSNTNYVTTNGVTVSELVVPIETIDQIVNSNSLIKPYTGHLALLKEKEDRMLLCVQRSLPEGQNLDELVENSIYGSDARRIVQNICEIYNVDRNGDPVSAEDVKIRDNNRRMLGLLFSENYLDRTNLAFELLQLMFDYKMPDITKFFDENHPVSDEEIIKFLDENYDEFYRVSKASTIIENIIRLKATNYKKNMDAVPECKFYYENLDDEVINKYNQICEYQNMYFYPLFYLLGRFGYMSHTLDGMIDPDRLEDAKERAKNSIESLKEMNLDAINAPMTVKFHEQSYIDEMNLLVYNANLENVIATDITEQKATEVSSKLLNRRRERETELALNPELKTKLDYLEDDNLKEALKLLVKPKTTNISFTELDEGFEEVANDAAEQEIPKDYYQGFKTLLDAFVNRNEGQIGKNVTKLFEDFMALSTNPEAYMNTDDVDNLIRLSDYAKAIPYLLNSRLVNRWVSDEYKNNLINKAKYVDAVCGITFSLYQKKNAQNKQNRADELKYANEYEKSLRSLADGRDLVDEVDEDILNDISLPEIIFNPREIVRLDTKEDIDLRKQTDSLMAVDEYDKLSLPYIMENEYFSDSAVSSKIKELFNSENSIMTLINIKSQLDEEFNTFSKGKCLMQGRYPLPDLSECYRIKKKGSLSSKFALMISLQSVVEQGSKMIGYSGADGKVGMFIDRGLMYAPRMMKELNRLLDEITNELLNQNGRSDEEAIDHFSEYAKLHMTFEFFAKKELQDAILDNLEKVGKNINTATDEEKVTAYLQASLSGAGLGLEIIQSDRMADKETDFFSISKGDQTRRSIEKYPINQYFTDLGNMIDIANTTEAVTKLNQPPFCGLSEETSNELFHELIDESVKKTIDSYVCSGLATNTFGMGLRDRMFAITKLVDLKDEKHNANETSFKSLVLDPLADLILAYPADVEIGMDKYNALYEKFTNSLRKYMSTHNPHTKAGDLKIRVVMELLAYLDDEEHFTNGLYYFDEEAKEMRLNDKI